MLISSLELSSSSRKALGFPACRFLQVLLPVSFLRVFSQEFTGRSSSRCLIFKVHLVDFRQPFGFRLRSLVSQALDYLTTFVSVCQVLFSTFFRSAFASLFRIKRFNILPHFLWFVKHFFDFFRSASLCLLNKHLNILPHLFWFVKYFFRSFRLSS